MRPSPQFIIYLVGVAVLGLLFAPVKAALGGRWLFLLSVVGYLVALRLLGVWVAKVRAQKEAKQ
jgi:hypothetical protein